MCGRYSLHTNKKTLAEAIAQAIAEQFEPSYNIGLGSAVLAIAQGADRPAAMSMMHWGLTHASKQPTPRHAFEIAGQSNAA
ncbi:MAG: putative SOS response-associated peptidase YedK [Lentimonas sp.]|jgi:putative SOS response-associated peptidase YedK